MYELEQLLRTVPAASVEHHATRNHFSVWLMARCMFELAKLLRPRSVGSIAGGIEGVRQALLDALREERLREQEGVITDYSPRRPLARAISCGSRRARLAARHGGSRSSEASSRASSWAGDRRLAGSNAARRGHRHRRIRQIRREKSAHRCHPQRGERCRALVALLGRPALRRTPPRPAQGSGDDERTARGSLLELARRLAAAAVRRHLHHLHFAE